jgi:hypothetical protein
MGRKASNQRVPKLVCECLGGLSSSQTPSTVIAPQHYLRQSRRREGEMRRLYLRADERGASVLGVAIGVFGFVLMVGSLIGWFAFPDQTPETTVKEVSRVSPSPSPKPDSVVHEESETIAEPAATPTSTTSTRRPRRRIAVPQRRRPPRRSCQSRQSAPKASSS